MVPDFAMDGDLMLGSLQGDIGENPATQMQEYRNYFNPGPSAEDQNQTAEFGLGEMENSHLIGQGIHEASFLGDGNG
jgi:hypothetical protein